MTGPDLTWGLDFDIQDNPGPDFVAALRAQFPAEREIDKVLTRKIAGGPGRRISARRSMTWRGTSMPSWSTSSAALISG